MIYKIALRLSQTIGRHTPHFTPKELDRMRYAIEAFLSESIKGAFLLFAFFLLNKMDAFIVITLTIIPIKPLIGGIHFKSHMRCAAGTFLFYVLCYASDAYISPHSFSIPVLYAITLVIIYAYAPLKRQKEDSNHIKWLSIASSALLFSIFLLPWFRHFLWLHSMTQFSLSAQLLIGGLFNEKQKKCV